MPAAKDWRPIESGSRGLRTAGSARRTKRLLGRGQTWLRIATPWILGAAILILHLRTAVAIDGLKENRFALDAVTLKLKWRHQFQFAGYYMARAKGYYQDAGLDVTIVESTDLDESTKAVVRGKAHFGIGSSDLAVSRANGEKIVVLACIFQHSPNIILARADAGISSVHDLKGKRVMLEPHAKELLAYLISG